MQAMLAATAADTERDTRDAAIVGLYVHWLASASPMADGDDGRIVIEDDRAASLAIDHVASGCSAWFMRSPKNEHGTTEAGTLLMQDVGRAGRGK